MARAVLREDGRRALDTYVSRCIAEADCFGALALISFAESVELISFSEYLFLLRALNR